MMAAVMEVRSGLVKERSLAPKEHGAYGQLFVPLAAALWLARGSLPALLLAASAGLAFFAHEPLLLLLGQRGKRAIQEAGERAQRRMFLLGALATASGLVGLALAPPLARWGALLPLGLAVLLAPLVLRHEEKSTSGELLAALALSSCALPSMLAGGISPTRGLVVTAVWGTVFCAATCAVRGVIASAKGRVSWVLRGGAFVLPVVAAAGFGLLPGHPVSTLALVPVSLLGIAFAAVPPRPRHLRTIGWALMAASVATLLILSIGLS